MTDRELLEWAAEAAGIATNGLGLCHDYKRNGEVWNPLNDDGQALRLFTCLTFRELYVSEIGVTVSWRRDGGHGLKCDEFASEHNGDLKAATRRAIVRAAAEIGRNMT